MPISLPSHSHGLLRAAIVMLSLAFWPIFSLEAMSEEAIVPQKSKPAISRSPAVTCAFPDNKRQKAPAWVCGKALGKLVLQAVGTAAKSKAGAQTTMERARTDARLKLAHQLAMHIEQAATRYATRHNISLPQSGRVNTPTVEKHLQAVLLGTRVTASATSRKGTHYVLLGVDAQQLRNSVIATAKAAIAADPSAWQALLSGTSPDQLAEKLAAH